MTDGDGDGDGERPAAPIEAGRSLYDHLWSVLLRGVAIIVPVIVTLYLISIALDLILSALDPFVALLEYLGFVDAVHRVEVVRLLLEWNVYQYVVGVFSELVALLILVGIVVVVGSIGHNRYGEHVIDAVDLAIASIPGVGTVYKSFRRMGDVMLDGDADNFQDVKLVQCLDDDMYVIGFETSAAPASVENAIDEEPMVTLFVPMAPNPVTGGFLTYVPESRVYEVDMTVEEGVKSILTSGVATGKGASDPESFGLGDVGDVATAEQFPDLLSSQTDDATQRSGDDSREP